MLSQPSASFSAFGTPTGIGVAVASGQAGTVPVTVPEALLGAAVVSGLTGPRPAMFRARERERDSTTSEY
jgi:hypothetical protein